MKRNHGQQKAEEQNKNMEPPPADPKPSTNALPNFFSLLGDPFNYILHLRSPYELLSLRVTSKKFCSAWENFVKSQLSTSIPNLQNIKMEEKYAAFSDIQNAEIKYLIQNKKAILENNQSSHSAIDAAFTKLEEVLNNDTSIAFQVKEKNLDIINECIIRNKIYQAQQNAYGAGKTLNCSGCHLTRFPNLFSDATLASFFAQLDTLYLSNNQLTALPDAIGQLPALKHFDVSNNKLTTLPSTIGQLTALRNFFASHNQLPTLPDAIGQLTALEHFDVSNNKLTALPVSIVQLTALWRFDVYNNQLTALPVSIEQLTALKWFDVSDNHLLALPGAMGQCPKLEKLIVKGNYLTEFPHNLGNILFSDLWGNLLSKDDCLALQKKRGDANDAASKATAIRLY